MLRFLNTETIVNLRTLKPGTIVSGTVVLFALTLLDPPLTVTASVIYLHIINMCCVYVNRHRATHLLQGQDRVTTKTMVNN